MGEDGDRRGGCSASRSPSSACSATSPARTSIELGCGTAYFSAWLARRGRARRRASTSRPAQLETARRMQRETGLEFPLVEAERRGRRRCRTRASTSRCRSTAHRSGATRSGGSRRRRGCSVPAASSSSSATRPLSMLCAPDDRTGRRTSAAAPAVRRPRAGWSGRARTVSSSTSAHGDWLAFLRENGFEVEALHELRAPEDAQRSRATTSSSAPSGRGSGRPRTSGTPVSGRERPAGTAARARVDVAAAARDPRAARHSVRRRRARATRRSSVIDPAQTVREHAAGKARSVAGAARRPGARRRHGGRSATDAVLGKPAYG